STPFLAALTNVGEIYPLNHRYAGRQTPLRQSVIGTSLLYTFTGLVAPQFDEATWKAWETTVPVNATWNPPTSAFTRRLALPRRRLPFPTGRSTMRLKFTRCTGMAVSM